MTNRVVLLDEVTFGYASAGRPVLDRCRLELNAGQRLGLIGPNGSGKTTLLALVVGLVRPQAGRVEVLGKTRTVEADFQEIRGPVGLLFQDSDDQLFCPTVAEDVAFGPLNLGKTRQQVRRIVAGALESLGLGGYEDRVTYKLSGGEKRLVALATVLAMAPEVLLLDEPAAGLDVEATQRVVSVLRALPQAMLVVSHDREFLSRVTGGTVELRSGCVHRVAPAVPPLE